MMKVTFFQVLSITFIMASCCYADEPNAGVGSNQVDEVPVTEVLANLSNWDNQLLKKQLIERISDNQALIVLLEELNLGEGDKEVDESFQDYVASLLEDQKGLAFIANQVTSISEAEKLNLDGVFIRKPLFHLRLQNELNENLEKTSSEILLYRMLYFSLMEKYAIR
ncbi:MAG: hypothetical protein V7785_02070 [Bermanella sp.]